MRILIADAEDKSRLALEALLAKQGHETVVTSSGDNAWRVLQEVDPPKMALLDWMLPSVNGLELCRRVRATASIRPTYIILLTSQATKKKLIEGLQAGADDYVSKPLDHDELEVRVYVGAQMVQLQSELAARVAELEETAAKMKLLQGLLPICSYCKSIRDDQDYWHRVEHYIGDHSEAQFSHGICPECWKKVVEPELQKMGIPIQEKKFDRPSQLNPMNHQPTFDRSVTTVRIVAEVGNWRLQVGRLRHVGNHQKCIPSADDPAAWNDQLANWNLQGPINWAVSGVHPQRRDELVKWLSQRGDNVQLISSSKQLPLKVAVRQPDKVGVDRLLNAVAVNTRRLRDVPAVIVDAGSAITIDCVDANGVFQGGAIMPGLRMMVKALHEGTALLPLIELNTNPHVPGTSTAQAMSAGVMCAAVGGIKEFISELLDSEEIGIAPQLFLGGGDGHVFESEFDRAVTLWPDMTLEGMRIVAWPEAGK